ncbi:MAG: hypothetical protein WA796_09260, partial [Pseudolabrys sp.]
MSVIGIEAHELRKFWRLLPHLTARLREESEPAIAAQDRGSNVDLKFLILGHFRACGHAHRSAGLIFDAPYIAGPRGLVTRL